MGSRLAALVLTMGVTLIGCSTPVPGEPSAATPADSLWAARTAYVGDNSRVVSLVQASGVAPGGTYTVSLQTARQPYGMTVTLRGPHTPLGDNTFARSATLVLGLVGNLDQISVISGEHTRALSAAEATEELGYDVKDLGRDKSKLAAYLRSTPG